MVYDILFAAFFLGVIVSPALIALRSNKKDETLSQSHTS